MWKSRALPILLITVVLAALTFTVTKPREPAYQGHSLSYWIDLNQHLDRGFQVFGEQVREINEAHAAITTIGTNGGLPYLTRWIRYRTPLWETNFTRRAPLGFRRKVNRFNQERADRAQASMQALMVLGTNAVSAIPELAALAMKTNIVDRDVAGRAAAVLRCLGPQAYPALLNVRLQELRDPKSPLRLSPWHYQIGWDETTRMLNTPGVLVTAALSNALNEARDDLGKRYGITR